MKEMMNRLQRLFLLMECLFLFPFRGRADTVVHHPRKIIVVPSGKLGDIVCCTPVFRAIRKHLPDAHITAMGGARTLRPILSDSGLVDNYIDIEEKGVMANIRRAKADVAIVTGLSFYPSALLYRAGIPLIIAPRVEGGYSPFETRPYKVLERLIATYPYRMGEYAPRERLNSLEVLGITSDDTKKHLGFSEAAERNIETFFDRNKIKIGGDFIVGISPSAGNKIKEWPEERFAEVIDYLAEKYHAKVLLVGGPADGGKVSGVIKSVKDTHAVVNTQGKFNIDELKALISKLDLFVSVDTGPVYIAEAFNIPTVDIVGPMNENEQPPRGFIHRNVIPERTSPELSVLNARFYDTKEALRQTTSITSKAVIAELDGLINDLREKRDI